MFPRVDKWERIMVLKHFFRSTDHAIKHLEKVMAIYIRQRKLTVLQNKARIHALKTKNAAAKEASYALTIKIP